MELMPTKLDDTIPFLVGKATAFGLAAIRPPLLMNPTQRHPIKAPFNVIDLKSQFIIPSPTSVH